VTRERVGSLLMSHTDTGGYPPSASRAPDSPAAFSESLGAKKKPRRWAGLSVKWVRMGDQTEICVVTAPLVHEGNTQAQNKSPAIKTGLQVSPAKSEWDTERKRLSRTTTS